MEYASKHGLNKIFWIVNGQVKEELFLNNPISYPLAIFKKRLHEATTHRTGKLVIVKAGLTIQTYYQQQSQLKLSLS